MLAGRGIPAIGDQRESPVIAAETDTHQTLMLDSGTQTERAEITEIYATLGEGVMELHHQWLVFRANRADRDRSSIFQFPVPNILRGIRTNRRTRQPLGGHAGVM